MSLIRLFLFFFVSILMFSFQVIQADGNGLSGSNDSTKWLNDTILHIINGEFHEADEKLIRWNASARSIERIVAITYNTFEGNFDLLINYSRASSSVRISQAVLAALWNEMISNSHMNLSNLSVLYDTLSACVINRQQASDEIINAAIEVRYNVRNDIIRIASEPLKISVVTRNFQRNPGIQELTNTIQKFETSTSNEIYRKLVDEVYYNVATDDLIRDMCSNKHASQVVTALEWVLEKVVQNRASASGRNEMLIADCLRRLQDKPSFAALPQEIKNNFALVVSRLQDSIRNLYFSDKVCLRNAYHSLNLYIYAGSEAAINDDSSNKAYWIAEKKDTEFMFKFKSDFEKNAFLFVSPFRSYAEVATDGADMRKTSTWEILAVGDKVAIRNEGIHRYLCMDTTTYGGSIYPTLHLKYSTKCKWTIERCG